MKDLRDQWFIIYGGISEFRNKNLSVFVGSNKMQSSLT
jgi:hypothetical protein